MMWRRTASGGKTSRCAHGWYELKGATVQFVQPFIMHHGWKAFERSLGASRIRCFPEI